MDLERVYCELRAEGERGIAGTALRFGTVADVGGRFKERFAPGSIELREPALVNREHRGTEPLAVVQFTLNGEGLEVRADLPHGARQDAALADVHTGKLAGLSIEFRATGQRWIGGVREITAAVVTGVALCVSPVYPDAQLELRARQAPSRRSLAGWI